MLMLTRLASLRPKLMLLYVALLDLGISCVLLARCGSLYAFVCLLEGSKISPILSAAVVSSFKATK